MVKDRGQDTEDRWAHSTLFNRPQQKQMEPSSSTLISKIEAEILQTSSNQLSHAIDLNIQDKGQNSEEVEILKIVKPTQPLDLSQCSRSRSKFWIFHQAYSKLMKVSFKVSKSSSPFKMLVNDLTSMKFVRGRSLIKDIIQTSQSHLTHLLADSNSTRNLHIRNQCVCFSSLKD